MRPINDTLWDGLPLFADDTAIGGVLLGADRASEFHAMVEQLEAQGFPKINMKFFGRYTPAVRAFFEKDFEYNSLAEKNIKNGYVRFHRAAVSKLLTPGLRWESYPDKGVVPIWYAEQEIAKEGYPVVTADLSQFASDLVALSTQCERLQAAMLEWKARRDRGDACPASFDGTYATLIDLYMLHPDSPFQLQSLATRLQNKFFLEKIRAQLKFKRLDDTIGADFMRWFRGWAKGDPINGVSYAAYSSGQSSLRALRSVMKFGMTWRLPGCEELYKIMYFIKFRHHKKRMQLPTMEQIVGLRTAARAIGAYSRALVYSIQFETTLRQIDVIGQWVELTHPTSSDYFHKNLKWIGPCWDQVDQNLIFKTTHIKTSRTTGARGEYDLTLCPMVMEDLEHIPVGERKGPIIINPVSGKPFLYQEFRNGFCRDRRCIQMSPKIQSRSFRMAGQTEGMGAGVCVEDRAAVAGHALETNMKYYSYDALSAHRRFMTARVEKRKNTLQERAAHVRKQKRWYLTNLVRQAEVPDEMK